MTSQEYIDWCVSLFNTFDKILDNNGVIAWNVSYGNDGTVNTNGLNLVWLTVAAIIERTNFSVADRIIWKKKSALPNNVSPNKLTRIVEDVFIFCRDDEFKTFQCNKEVKSISKTGQKFYSPIYNFIEAKNNDGKRDLNKATYSSELCSKILSIYCKEGELVYDPFMGTGTTAVACSQMGLKYLGSELSAAQCEFAIDRLSKLEVAC
jgi:DNA modification methylase